MPYESRNLVFSIVDSDGATTRDLSAYLTGVSGLPGERELVDVTRLGDTGHRFVTSLWNGRFTLNGLYDKTATAGPDTVLTNLLANTTASPFAFGPTGSSSGASPVNRKVSGSAWIRSYTIQGQVGAAVAFTAEGQVEGNVSVGTWT